MKISLDELKYFIARAHQNTYANKSALKVSPARLASEDYQYEEGDLIYHDTYFGSHDFIGNEIVYEENKPVWGMSYHGYLTKPDISESKVYDFLKQSLMQKCTDIIPARGPSRYSMALWKYSNSLDGTLDRFSGIEIISLGGGEVYRGWYNGGFVG